MGFAGLRLLYPLNHAEDELGVFLGASYFRFLCARAFYGLSARGIAIDTAQPKPEEFPIFTEFWLERPSADAKTL
jgi:glucans biosynthesis protein